MQKCLNVVFSTNTLFSQVRFTKPPHDPEGKYHDDLGNLETTTIKYYSDCTASTPEAASHLKLTLISITSLHMKFNDCP